MLRIIGLVVAIALGDSLNPSTIGPALYVASGDRARVGVLEFTLAVLATGLAMLIAAAVIWHQRERLGQRDLPNPNPKRKSSLLLGATIIAIELPTAFPYLAAITAGLGSTRDLARQLLLVGVYNLCFVLPLIAILATLLIASDDADRILTRGREAIEQRWPAVFAGLLLLGGLVLAVIGALGL